MTSAPPQLYPYTSELSDYFGSLRYEDLPSPLVRQTKRVLRDTIAGILGGASLPFSSKLLATLSKISGPGSSTLIPGTGLELDERSAAMHSAGMIVTVNNMSGYRSALAPGLHPPEVVIPVLLALAQSAPYSGKEFITAAAVGMELATRLGLAVMPSHALKGFHQCATIGSIAGAVAAAKLWGGGPDEIADTIGTSVIFSPMAIMNLYLGVSPTDEKYPMVKPLDSPYAARTAIDSAFYAREGYGGQKYALEGQIGFCRTTTAEEPDFAALNAELGQSFRSEQVYFKLYGGSRWAHGATDLTLAIVGDHDLRPDDIEEIEVESIRLIAVRTVETSTTSNVWECLTGSVPYFLAHAIKYPDEMLEPEFYSDFTRPSRLADLHDYRKRIHMVESPEYTKQYPGKVPTRVTIRTTSGASYSEYSEFMRGDEPELPLADEELDAKFRRFSGKVLSEQGTASLDASLAGLEDIEDMRELISLLRAEHSAVVPSDDALTGLIP